MALYAPSPLGFILLNDGSNYILVPTVRLLSFPTMARSLASLNSFGQHTSTPRFNMRPQRCTISRTPRPLLVSLHTPSALVLVSLCMLPASSSRISSSHFVGSRTRFTTIFGICHANLHEWLRPSSISTRIALRLSRDVWIKGKMRLSDCSPFRPLRLAVLLQHATVTSSHFPTGTMSHSLSFQGT